MQRVLCLSPRDVDIMLSFINDASTMCVAKQAPSKVVRRAEAQPTPGLAPSVSVVETLLSHSRLQVHVGHPTLLDLHKQP